MIENTRFGFTVAERERSGNLVWDVLIGGIPSTVERLPNGNTFVVSGNHLIEVSPNKKIVKKLLVPPNGMDCGQRLRDGNFAVVYRKYTKTEQLRFILELDPEGKELARVPLGSISDIGSIQKLATGAYLLAMPEVNRVIEVDSAGKVLWEVAIEHPQHVSRLRNGNTLVACWPTNQVVEFDPRGKQVWRLKTQMQPNAHRR